MTSSDLSDRPVRPRFRATRAEAAVRALVLDR
jgi:hypothetical protein